MERSHFYEPKHTPDFTYSIFLLGTNPRPTLSIRSTVKSSTAVYMCVCVFFKYSESLRWIKLTQLRAHYSPRESERQLGKFRLRSTAETLDMKANKKARIGRRVQNKTALSVRESQRTLFGSIIGKRKLYQTIATMPRKGHASKLSARTRRRLMGEVNERPTITLSGLLRSRARSGVKVRERNKSRSLHKHRLVREEGTKSSRYGNRKGMRNLRKMPTWTILIGPNIYQETSNWPVENGVRT